MSVPGETGEGTGMEEKGDSAGSQETNERMRAGGVIGAVEGTKQAQDQTTGVPGGSQQSGPRKGTKNKNNAIFPQTREP